MVVLVPIKASAITYIIHHPEDPHGNVTRPFEKTFQASAVCDQSARDLGLLHQAPEAHKWRLSSIVSKENYEMKQLI